ncbi:MAG: alkaline phosphatase family protein [Ferruginibacter sp.]|nr:alkaline phosphatase family protein [Chitinophagaceae bacterium]
MLRHIIIALLLVSGFVNAQRQTENIIIITTDGFRWQEVFKGMDSAIGNNSKFNQGDSATIYKNYWHNNEQERRKKLMPFLWSTVITKGQLFGNRVLGSKVDNANSLWFSYPGYSEIFTGYVDTSIKTNDHPPNPNITVLEYLNKQPRLKGKVAAFGAWEAFDRILNEKRSGIPVVSGFNSMGGKNPTPNERLMNAMLKDAHKPWGVDECFDVFTHYGAMEYLKTKKPKVLYIAYGETDEWAHAGQYRSYLDAGHQVDAWIKEIWNYVQTDPQYKNKTTLFITVDHGRGDIEKEEWTSHNNKIQDSHEIWFGVIGPDTPVRGELNSEMQLYQQQFAQTIAKLMGYTYVARHPVASEIFYIFKMKK